MTLENQLQQILDIKEDIKGVLNDKGIETGNDFSTYASKIKQVQGGSAFNLFDIKVSDHKLENNEALGWAEQGTKVYKTDYPDFYEKCLEEYNNSPIQRTCLKQNINIVGDIISNNGILSGFEGACYAQIPNQFSLTSPFEINCAITTSDDVTTQSCFFSFGDGFQMCLIQLNGKFTYFVGTNGSNWLNGNNCTGSNSILPNTKYYIKLSFDGKKYVANISLNNKDWLQDYTYSTSSYPQTGTGKLGVYRAGKGFPWLGTIHLEDCNIYLNNQLYWTGGIFQDLHVVSNDHKYYNVNDKEIIDIIYQQMGNADFYGIDQESEYIILPRNSHFDQEKAVRKTYYCVGNTIKDDAIIDLTKEIELNNPFSLLDYKFSEYELNNLSWLCSNGQYNSKAIYPSVYDLLLKIYNGTETKAGVSVKLSTDESATQYDFRINTAEETFMLPTKVKLAGGKAIAGNGMALGLSTGAQNFGLFTGYNSGYGYNLKGKGDAYGQAICRYVDGQLNERIAGITGVTTDPAKSGIETSDSDLYLYFYVGETVQNANIIDAGKIQTQLVDKLQTDLTNLPQETKSYLTGLGMPSENTLIYN